MIKKIEVSEIYTQCFGTTGRQKIQLQKPTQLLDFYFTESRVTGPFSST